MERTKIDIHKTKEKYERAKERLRNDGSISQRNRELILGFLRDAELGKTVLHRQKKQLCKRTCSKYLTNLKTMVQLLKMNFDNVTLADMETFVYYLQNGVFQKKNQKTYSDETKRDFKITLKKFYKWQQGNNEKYPELVKWIDTAQQPKEHISLNEKQIDQIIAEAKTTLDKAFISVLFDLGARAEEFLNIQREDVQKTATGYRVHIHFSKTFSRTLPLDKSIHYLERWLKVRPRKDDQLFPFSYWQCLRRLKRLGKQTLNVPITPQMIRHSKATQLAQAGVGRYQMCEWMGWAMSSKMPDRYICREGIDNQKTLEEIRRKRQ